MKKKLYLRWLSALFLIIIPFACRKSIPNTNLLVQHPAGDSTQVNQSNGSNQSVPYPQSGITGCTFGPDYGDTLIYPQPTSGPDYMVIPINNPGAGKYYSWPVGLVIDSVTGAIDVTQSESGEKFAIGFVKNGTTDTCLENIIIAGSSYMDSVYVLADQETQAYPYFNANPAMPSPCNGSSPNGPACQFDVTGQANSQKIKINNNTGVINLQETLNGAFGVLPLNGQTVTTTMYYKLNDGSNNALQQITLEFMYYDKKSNIGAGILNNILMKLNNILTGNLISTSTNPRPPLIIITRFN